MGMPHRLEVQCHSRSNPGRGSTPSSGVYVDRIAGDGGRPALLAAVAVPSMARMIDSTRLTGNSNDFLAAMYLARSEAIKRNERVAMCKSPTAVACRAGGGWDRAGSCSTTRTTTAPGCGRNGRPSRPSVGRRTPAVGQPDRRPLHFVHAVRPHPPGQRRLPDGHADAVQRIRGRLRYRPGRSSSTTPGARE